MKISVNDIELLTLSKIQKDVIKNNVHADQFDMDMKRRLEWVLTHKYEQCFKEMKEEWDPLLAQRVESVPTDKDAYAQLVFSQPDYRDRKSRDLEGV